MVHNEVLFVTMHEVILAFAGPMASPKLDTVIIFLYTCQHSIQFLHTAIRPMISVLLF